jgi:hypothetical protein
MRPALLAVALAALPAAAQVPFPPFELVLGQDAPAAAFRARLRSGAAFVTGSGELVYALERAGGPPLVESFDGGRAVPVGLDEAATVVSRFAGSDPARWSRGAPTFERLDLGAVWPGVRVELEARDGDVEKRFHVAPHAAPESIAVRVHGACALRVAADGTLVAATEAGELVSSAPVAWQERGGRREPVEVAYRVAGEVYGFELGTYDPGRELVIDPILQSTYLGGLDSGGASERAAALAYDGASGSVYAVGRTNAANFPGTAGGAFPSWSNNLDVFVAKLSDDLRTLQRATYYGGSNDESFDDVDPAVPALSVAVGPGGVYVCGATRSVDLPGVAGGADPTFSGLQDGFVARFDAGLTSLVGATYHGAVEASGDQDLATDLALDPGSGDVFVVGTVAGAMAGTAGAAQPVPAGGRDAYVSRLSGDLATLVRTSYAGSSNCVELGKAVALAGGKVYLAGAAFDDASPPIQPSDLLTLTSGGAGAAQAVNAGPDAFVLALNPALTAYVGGTFYGGQGIEYGEDLAVATSGDVYVTGVTTAYDLPGSAGGAQPALAGSDDAFVARLSGGLGAILGASYLGGQAGEWGWGVAVHPTNADVYVTGHSAAPPATADFPALAGGAQPFANGGYECFLTRLTPDLSAFVQSTFFGGSWDEQGFDLAFDAASGDVLVAGASGSEDLPFVAGGADSSWHGTEEGFVARLDAGLGFGAPLTYCVSGWTSNGCRAGIVASANPSASLASPCLLTVTAVEGQKSGIVFYGINGPNALPWCSSSTSSLCVKPPVQRSPAQSSGGTNGACDGTLAPDWNAFQAANPGALGNPFSPGATVYAQAWFRDPPACRTTNLSNAVAMAVQP